MDRMEPMNRELKGVKYTPYSGSHHIPEGLQVFPRDPTSPENPSFTGLRKHACPLVLSKFMRRRAERQMRKHREGS